MKKILVILLIIMSGVNVFAGCQFNYEYKTATLQNTQKSTKDFAKKIQKRIMKGPNSFNTDSGTYNQWTGQNNSTWCTDESTFTTALASGSKARIQMKANDGRCGYQYKDLGSIDFGEPIEYIESVTFDYSSSGRGCSSRSGSNISVSNNGSSSNVYMGNLSYCPGYSAQTPLIYATIKSIVAVTPPVCPSGYVADGANCSKIITYNYKNYVCDANDTNSQGFAWELETPAQNDGAKLDPDVNAMNDLSGDLYSHLQPPRCKRKYQACTIDCPSPLVLDISSGRCVADYEAICAYKGMVYNRNLNICEKENQCLYAGAQKDSNSSYCVMQSDCTVINGICGEEPRKSCEISGFLYNGLINQCEKPTACTELEYVLDSGLCGSTPYCNDGDVQSSEECINTVNVQKSCSPDARDGNLCYVSSGTDTASNTITTSRQLIKTELSGGFKDGEYGDVSGTLCTDSAYDCQFRLVKIAANDTGDKLCFTDAQGISSCVSIVGDCTLSGTIENAKGIKQIKVESGNKIVGYDLAHGTQSLGSIQSSCSVSGKVGNFEGEFVSSDITSVKADKSDILFWDRYKRGFIGVISFLPTIPQKDLDEGYVYADNDVYLLLKKGFTAFYSKDDTSVYGVYNGFISKADCETLIDGTSFYISQPESTFEKEIISGLNFKSADNYNYNDGDLQHGSCVVKSTVSQSFSSQKFSTKTVHIDDASAIFVCSPFACKDHYCQYNQCPTNFTGSLYDQSYFDKIVGTSFPDAATNTVCTDQLCDSNKPYFEYCGNTRGCDNKANIYQQSDGTCVEVTCANGDQLDLSTGKCIGYGCNGSIERDGKCYKTLY